MASYKITYFNGRGRAELSRLLFAISGTSYTDERLTFEEWPARKAGTPLGQLPVFSIDGKGYPQSIAFARYIANKTGLAGKNDLEKFQADVVVETVGDLTDALYKFMFEKDETKKAENKKAAFEVAGPKMFGALEGWLESYGKNSGYFLESGLSWADICVFDILEKWAEHDKTAMTKFTKLAAHSKKIREQAKVAEWLKTRPATEF